MVNVAVLALEEFRKSISLKLPAVTAEELTVKMLLPAVELISKSMMPPPAALPLRRTAHDAGVGREGAVAGGGVIKELNEPAFGAADGAPPAVNMPVPAFAPLSNRIKPSESPLTAPPSAKKYPCRRSRYQEREYAPATGGSRGAAVADESGITARAGTIEESDGSTAAIGGIGAGEKELCLRRVVGDAATTDRQHWAGRRDVKDAPAAIEGNSTYLDVSRE